MGRTRGEPAPFGSGARHVADRVEGRFGGRAQRFIRRVLERLPERPDRDRGRSRSLQRLVDDGNRKRAALPERFGLTPPSDSAPRLSRSVRSPDRLVRRRAKRRKLERIVQVRRPLSTGCDGRRHGSRCHHDRRQYLWRPAGGMRTRHERDRRWRRSAQRPANEPDIEHALDRQPTTDRAPRRTVRRAHRLGGLGSHGIERQRRGRRRCGLRSLDRAHRHGRRIGERAHRQLRRAPRLVPHRHGRGRGRRRPLERPDDVRDFQRAGLRHGSDPVALDADGGRSASPRPSDGRPPCETRAVRTEPSRSPRSACPNPRRASSCGRGHSASRGSSECERNASRVEFVAGVRAIRRVSRSARP